MTDMIRASINVSELEQIIQAYQILDEMKSINVVRIKNKITSDLQNVSINFIFNNSIIGEIQIRFGNKSPNYYTNHFLYELFRADSIS